MSNRNQNSRPGLICRHCGREITAKDTNSLVFLIREHLERCQYEAYLQIEEESRLQMQLALKEVKA